MLVAPALVLSGHCPDGRQALDRSLLLVDRRGPVEEMLLLVGEHKSIEVSSDREPELVG